MMIPQTQRDREHAADLRAALDADADEYARQALVIMQSAIRQIEALTSPYTRVQLDFDDRRAVFAALTDLLADSVVFSGRWGEEAQANWRREARNVWPAQKEAV